MNRLRLALLAAVAVAVLISLACGGDTTAAPDTPAPSPIAPAAAPTAVEIAPTVASIPSALSVANAFFEAFNEGDIGGLRSIYADDVVSAFGPVPYYGFASISGVSAVLEDDRQRIDLHAHFTPSNIQAVGNTVTGQFTYRDEGVSSVSGSISFSVEQEKIAGIVITWDMAVPVKVGGSVGEHIPDFELRLSDGSGVSSAALLGDRQPTFLFFFATW